MSAASDPIEQGRPHGAGMCGAKNRRGVPCRRPPTRGATRCKFHGGLTPIGPASPHWRHGRYSRIFSRIGRGPADERALRDPKLGSVREHLAVYETRLQDLFSRLGDASGSGHTLSWDADSAANTGATPCPPARLSVVVERDPSEARIWQEVCELLELRRRLTETEARYLLRSGQSLTAEQVMALLGTVAQLVKRYVTDRGVLTQLARELRLLSPGCAGELSPAQD